MILPIVWAIFLLSAIAAVCVGLAVWQTFDKFPVDKLPVDKTPPRFRG